jgi:sugar diacid utilization regulator
MLTAAALDGTRPSPAQLRAIAELGRHAAEHGIGASAAVERYLSAAGHLWEQLPQRAPARESGLRNAQGVHGAARQVLRLLDNTIAALLTGHQEARQEMIRQEQTTRQEFIDDLLRGDADVAGMVQRGEPFGLDLAAVHHVALAAPTGSRSDVDRAALGLERRVVDLFGDRDVLVATKDARIVVVVPGTVEPPPAGTETTLALSRTLTEQLGYATGQASGWRVAAGRAFPGAFGVARSYEEARETLDLGTRLNLETATLDPGELLVYRVLGRDQAAMIDLVSSTLTPLASARGGARPLLDTLHSYFSHGENATETARHLHLSVRAVTYRLARVKHLTGYDPTSPEQRFTLHAAVLGARLLDWPTRPLPVAS